MPGASGAPITTIIPQRIDRLRWSRWHWLVLRPKNEFAAESLLEAFEELWTVHRLKMRAGYGLALLRAAG
ncbi:MAG: hypothetical protein ABI988_08735 [Nitrospirota bacterium]